MTDEEILIKAMDAEPTSVAPMAALADLLLERGDARGEGLAVLAQYGKVGVRATGEYPLYHCYYGGFLGLTIGYGDETVLVPLTAVIDPEWLHVATDQKWAVYGPEYRQYRKDLTRPAFVRMLLARAWAGADPDARDRMAFNTSPAGGESAVKPDVEASWAWLRKFAADLPRHRGEWDSYYDDTNEGDLEPVTLEELMERADEFQADEEYWNEGPRFEGFSNNDDFWSHYRIATGKIPKRISNFFSCSC